DRVDILGMKVRIADAALLVGAVEEISVEGSERVKERAVAALIVLVVEISDALGRVIVDDLDAISGRTLPQQFGGDGDLGKGHRSVGRAETQARVLRDDR